MPHRCCQPRWRQRGCSCLSSLHIALQVLDAVRDVAWHNATWPVAEQQTIGCASLSLVVLVHLAAWMPVIALTSPPVRKHEKKAWDDPEENEPERTFQTELRSQEPSWEQKAGLHDEHAAYSRQFSARELASKDPVQVGVVYTLDQEQGYQSCAAARPAHQYLHGCQIAHGSKHTRRYLPFSNKILSRSEFL